MELLYAYHSLANVGPPSTQDVATAGVSSQEEGTPGYILGVVLGNGRQGKNC